MGYFDDEQNQKEIDQAAKKSLSIYKPGIYVVKLLKVEKRLSKKGGLYLILTFGDKFHKPVEKMFGWQGKYKDDELKKLGVWANMGFGKKIEVNSPLNDTEEVEQVCDFFNQFVGQEVQVAMSTREELFSKEEDGEFKLIKFVKNDIFALTGLKHSLIISDMSRLQKGLNPVNQAKYDAYQDEKARNTEETKQEPQIEDLDVNVDEEGSPF